MNTLQVSKFKAQCLGILKVVRDTGQPLALTLRGETLAIVQPPDARHPGHPESVAATLENLRPLLLAGEGEFEAPERSAPRAPATDPLPEES
jgi:hypothetical protein